MGWWPFRRGGTDGHSDSGNSSNSSDTGTADQASSQPIFLEDVPAKYTQTTPTQGQQGPGEQPAEGFSVSKEVKSFVGTLTPQHFYFSNLVQIPCFREAGLSGFTCFFVFSSVLYFYHRSLRKAVNWGFGGLLLGSIFGWEHCNNTRRNSQMAVKLAQERFERKKSGQTPSDTSSDS